MPSEQSPDKDGQSDTPRYDALLERAHNPVRFDFKVEDLWDALLDTERGLAKAREVANRETMAAAHWKAKAESVPSAIQEPVRITEVVGADGKGVAAPCAISGCALMTGDTVMPSSEPATADNLLDYVRIDLTEAGGTRSMIECDKERLLGLLQKLTSLPSATLSADSLLRRARAVLPQRDYHKADRTEALAVRDAIDAYFDGVDSEGGGK